MTASAAPPINASAGACTAPAATPSALLELVNSSKLHLSLCADFQRNTWTFSGASAGDVDGGLFALIPQNAISAAINKDSTEQQERASSGKIIPGALTSAVLPAIGHAWPEQGGIYLGVCRGADNQPPQHLIASTNPDATFMGIWGERGQDVTGAKSRFDGRANTLAMAAAGCDIARRVNALRIDGHADWFIPSQAQLQLASAIAPEAFDQDAYHWSSTQDSSHGAFVQDFENGYSYWSNKDYERRVRAFREIQLEALTT